MKKIVKYASFIIRSSPMGFVTSSFLYILNILFAAGLYGMASFIISLAALHPSYDRMMIPVVSVRLFGIGRAVLSYTQRYCSHDSTFRILKDLRLKLYDKMLPNLPNYETRRAQNLSKLIADVELLQEGILRLIYPLVSSVFLLLTGIGIAYLIHPFLSLVFIILFMINAYLFPMIMFYININKKSSIDYDNQKIYEDLLELKEGINEIIANGREENWISRIENRLSGMNGTIEKQQSVVAFCETIIVFLQGISIIAILLAASYLSVGGKLSGIYLAAGTLALTTLVTEVILPSQTYFKFSGLRRAADTIFEGEEQKYSNVEKEEVELKGDALYVSNISWNYQGGKKIFQGFSMELKKGTIVAVVGESGSGKSTLINLILGFLKPREGEITFGETNIMELHESERMKLFSVVDQKPFFFHQTIYENLHMANSYASEEEIMEVLRKVHLENLIHASKKGLHTPMHEWGANLSGGELQRLAIARALLKNSLFYIFDEPTAGLDMVNEKIIMELIFELSIEHGVLLITHRPNMMENVHSVIRI